MIEHRDDCRRDIMIRDGRIK